jgi:hypothetical protein
LKLAAPALVDRMARRALARSDGQHDRLQQERP